MTRRVEPILRPAECDPMTAPNPLHQVPTFTTKSATPEPAPISLRVMDPADPRSDVPEPALDPTTGLWSSAGLERFLRAARHAGEGVALLHIALDGVGALRARAGDGAADAVVRAVGTRLREVVRAAEAMGRAGPDALIVVLRTTSVEDGRRVCARLGRHMTRAPVPLNPSVQPVALSMGFVGIVAGSRTPLSRLRAAAADAARGAADGEMAVAADPGPAGAQASANTMRSRP